MTPTGHSVDRNCCWVHDLGRGYAGLLLGCIHCRFWGSAMKRREYITLLVVAAGIWPSVRLLSRRQFANVPAPVRPMTALASRQYAASRRQPRQLQRTRRAEAARP